MNEAQSSVLISELPMLRKKKTKTSFIPIILSGIPNNQATTDQEELKAFPKTLYEDLYEKRSETPFARSYTGSESKRKRINKG